MRRPRFSIDITINRALKQDREELEAFFKERSICSNSQIAEIGATFKRAHKVIYGLCVWSNEFVRSPIHQRVFLEELRSDVLQSIHMSLIGFKKPVALLLRSAIEDLLRHIYYYDHPIEFEKLEKKPSSYTRMNQLWKYAKEHPRLEELFAESKAIELLENEYAVFSRSVHSSSASHMNLTKSLSEIGFDQGFFEGYGRKVSVLARNINFVLFAFYQKTLESFNPPWERFLLDMISEGYRRLLSKET